MTLNNVVQPKRIAPHHEFVIVTSSPRHARRSTQKCSTAATPQQLSGRSGLGTRDCSGLLGTSEWLNPSEPRSCPSSEPMNTKKYQAEISTVFRDHLKLITTSGIFCYLPPSVILKLLISNCKWLIDPKVINWAPIVLIILAIVLSYRTTRPPNNSCKLNYFKLKLHGQLYKYSIYITQFILLMSILLVGFHFAHGAHARPEVVESEQTNRLSSSWEDRFLNFLFWRRKNRRASRASVVYTWRLE